MSDDVQMMHAATLVCLRRHVGTSMSSSSQWDVLLGQNEVKNWLRSTPTSTRIMRYPGEWKFPGGAVDSSDKSLKATALRELREEFIGLTPMEDEAKVHFFATERTKAIQNRSYDMHNFIAFAEENTTWLNGKEVDVVNTALKKKRIFFKECLASGSFWALDEKEKMEISPEVHSVHWFPIDEAMQMMLSSLEKDRIPPPVNKWQENEFAEHGVERRDPMFKTYLVLKKIAAFESSDKLLTFLHEQSMPSITSNL